MPDDRNGAPPGPPTPFDRARGTNGVPSQGRHSNGVPQRPVDLPTRSLPVDVADGPLDLVAVQADDELVNALGTGAVVTYGDRARGSDPDLRRTRDERVVAMLAAWRAEIEAEPIPELIDLDTAVAAVVAGVKADAAGTRRKRAARLRHLAPLAAAAAIIVATVTGVGLGSQNAMPGDTLWPVQKVVNPDRAVSVETKLVVESRFDEVRTALASRRHGDRRQPAAGNQRGDPGGPRRGGAAAAHPGAGVPGREAGRHVTGRARGPVDAAGEQADRPLDDVARHAAVTVGLRVELVVEVGGLGRPVAVAVGRSGRPA